MKDELFVGGNKYISSKRAAKLTGYTADYIGQLTRAGKVPGKLVGRAKFVDERAILEYKQESILAKKEESQARSTEYKKGRKVPLSVSEKAITDALAKVSSPKKTEFVPKRTQVVSVLENKTGDLEKSILGLLLIFPNYLDFAQTVLEKEDFNDPDAASAFDLLIKYYNKKGDFSESKFLSTLPKAESEQVKLYILAVESEFADFDDEKKAEEIYFGIKRLKKMSLDVKKRELSEKIANFEGSGKKDEAKKTLSELQKLLEEEQEII